ncbi:MAG: hypothetical protein E6767_08915 [Dysgonomonas sp.]|nr:hypothetical protein [Dysgonomonas sp.]
MDKLFYELYHVYDNDEFEEISKFIGVFSSMEKVDNAIEHLIKQSGFNNFSKDNIIISQSKLNEYEWKEGFCSWKYAYEYQNKEK